MELKLDRNKTYGLALEGGGAKGAYQIGAWKALREAGIRFSAVSGTSVGALNGAMIVMDDLEKAENVWNNIHFSQVMDVDDEEMRRLMNRDIPLSELKSTLRSVADIVRNRGFDVTPLRNWVAEVVDADKICHSDTDFFIVTYSLSDHQELELKASDLDKDELCDMLLASAYLPAFRLEKLGGKYYADGGVQDVVPIHALVENGCKDIIALRIFGFGIEKRFRIPDDVHVTTIGPTVDLGNILNFDAEQSRKNMRLGYFDAQRVLYGLYGSTYYIDRTMSEDAARQQLLEYLGTDDGSLRTFHEKTLPQIARALSTRIHCLCGAFPVSRTLTPNSSARFFAASSGSDCAVIWLERKSTEMDCSHSAAFARSSFRSVCWSSTRRAARILCPMSSCTRSFIASVSSSRMISGICTSSRRSRSFASASFAFSAFSWFCFRISSVTSAAVICV